MIDRNITKVSYWTPWPTSICRLIWIVLERIFLSLYHLFPSAFGQSFLDWLTGLYRQKIILYSGLQEGHCMRHCCDFRIGQAFVTIPEYGTKLRKHEEKEQPVIVFVYSKGNRSGEGTITSSKFRRRKSIHLFVSIIFCEMQQCDYIPVPTGWTGFEVPNFTELSDNRPINQS